MYGFAITGKKKNVIAFVTKMKETFNTLGTKGINLLLQDNEVRKVLELEHSVKIGV